MQKRWQQEYEWLTGTGDPLNQPIIYGHRLPTAAEMRQGPFFGAPVMMAPGETYAQAVKNWATYVCRSSNPGPGFCEWSETVGNSPANGWDAVFTVLGAVGLAAGGSALRGAAAPLGREAVLGAVGRGSASIEPIASAAAKEITILGRYERGVDAYIGKPGYNTLSVPGKGTGKWNWTRNKRFIDDAIEGGGEIRLVTDPFTPLYRGGNVYQRELRYLRDRGFTFEAQADYWVVTRGR